MSNPKIAVGVGAGHSKGVTSRTSQVPDGPAAPTSTPIFVLHHHSFRPYALLDDDVVESR